MEKKVACLSIDENILVMKRIKLKNILKSAVRLRNWREVELYEDKENYYIVSNERCVVLQKNTPEGKLLKYLLNEGEKE